MNFRTTGLPMTESNDDSDPKVMLEDLLREADTLKRVALAKRARRERRDLERAFEGRLMIVVILGLIPNL